MGKYFEITDEIMKNAIDYMPIEMKVDTAKTIAGQCVYSVPTAKQNEIGEKVLALPNLKCEDRELKLMCLLNVLLEYYLQLELKEPLDIDVFNYYAGGALLNQLERFKSNFELKNKAFDLLADYKELRKMVDMEINNLITVSNDTLGRLTATIALFTTPENLKKIAEELQKLGNEQGTKAVEQVENG